MIDSLKPYLNYDHIYKFTIAVIVLVVGLALTRFLSRSIISALRKKLDQHQQMLLHKIITYLGTALTFITVLNELGINLQVILGAAGLATVAIGFAAQTSMSNLISGIFTILEKPFIVGDSIRLGGGTTGEVISIGLLSTQLKTADGIMVRIPNETLMKSEITNLTRFPIRRFDLKIGIGYEADLAVAQSTLIEAAKRHSLVLKDPAPAVVFQNLSDSSVNVMLSVWVANDKYGDVQLGLCQLIKSALEKAQISIPYPYRQVILTSTNLPSQLPS